MRATLKLFHWVQYSFFIKNYIELEKLRFNKSVKIETDSECYSYRAVNSNFKCEYRVNVGYNK